MARYTNIDLIKAFSRGAREGKSTTGNLYIQGEKLVNYATVIAYRGCDGVYLNTHKYSTTTSKIQTYIKRYCDVVGTWCE